MKQTRGLSNEFREHLRSGHLRPLLNRVYGDATLDMEIREQAVNIYYRGGSLLKVAPVPRKPSMYTFTFDSNYSPDKTATDLGLPSPTVHSATDATAWVESIPRLKDTMDLWFGKHPKDERALQQMVVWENNDSPWAGGTDWFIVDIEYDNHQGARFDLVGLCWESSASPRKLAKDYRPRLTILEMKTGDGALTGKAGVEAHLRQLHQFLGDAGRVQSFKQEMLAVFAQKRELGLIRSLRSNKNAVRALNDEIDVVFLIAGHDPASGKLDRILDVLQRDGATAIPGARLSLCRANFMGYGLYRENVRDIAEFLPGTATS